MAVLLAAAIVCFIIAFSVKGAEFMQYVAGGLFVAAVAASAEFIRKKN
ncbi:hypothetical protein ACWEOE_39305 [Amycolatopsis sp. NPDC004368]